MKNNNIFKSILIVIILIIINKNIFAINTENIEDIYVGIKCKSLINDFFQAKYDTKTKKLYLGVTSLFYFLEIYDVNVNLEKRNIEVIVDDKDIHTTISKEHSFVANDELYVDLTTYEKQLNFRKISFNYEYLRVNVFPKFVLPLDERINGKLARLRLNNEKLEENMKENIIYTPKKLITPGFLKLRYNKYNINSKEKGDFNYSYGDQFLYGSLYLNGNINNHKVISYGNLKYTNIYDKKDLIFGSINTNTPNFIRIKNNVLGVSYRTNQTYLYRDGADVIIRGEAINAQIIELYRGNILIDYIYPDSKNFVFRVNNNDIGETYIIKIYYANGKIEKRKIYSINDINMMKTGKSKFNFDIGKQTSDGKYEFSSEYFYGVNNYMTLKTGYDDLISDYNKKYKLLKTGFLFNSRQKIMPTLIDYQNYYDLYNEENNYKLDIIQKYKEYQLQYNREEYSRSVYEENDMKNYESFSLGRSFTNNYFEIGGSRYLKNYKNNYTKKEYSKYIYWSNTYFSPFYYSLKFEDRKDEYIISPTITHYGNFIFIMKSDLKKHKKNDNWNNYYEIRMDKRNIPIIENKLYSDLGAFIKYNDYNKNYSYGINFNIELDDFIYLRTYTETDRERKYSNRKNTSIEVEKFIDLSNPTENISSNSYVDQAMIYGKIFMDKNGNEKFDANDIPLKDVCIEGSGMTTKTNKNGNYNLNGLYGNNLVKIKIDRTSIDPMYKPVLDNIEISTQNSMRYKLDIPVQAISIISGNIFGDNGVNLEKNISLILVQLIKNGVVCYETKPEFDGLYAFQEVLPGTYTIKFIYLGKNKNINFDKNNLKINIPVTVEGEYYEGFNTKLKNNK